MRMRTVSRLTLVLLIDDSGTFWSVLVLGCFPIIMLIWSKLLHALFSIRLWHTADRWMRPLISLRHTTDRWLWPLIIDCVHWSAYGTPLINVYYRWSIVLTDICPLWHSICFEFELLQCGLPCPASYTGRAIHAFQMRCGGPLALNYFLPSFFMTAQHTL